MDRDQERETEEWIETRRERNRDGYIKGKRDRGMEKFVERYSGMHGK